MAGSFKSVNIKKLTHTVFVVGGSAQHNYVHVVSRSTVHVLA